VLEEHRHVLDELVQLLLTNETVEGSEIYALAGRPEPAGGEGVTVAPERATALEKEPAAGGTEGMEEYPGPTP
jgi:hypothetical protein